MRGNCKKRWKLREELFFYWCGSHLRGKRPIFRARTTAPSRSTGWPRTQPTRRHVPTRPLYLSGPRPEDR
ncbi:unnamed protein product [Chondrus crispus]|uniref:Uncharacterized protein n=1 Tax=Chondrus crispus TaxID=2769 RepID=R7QCQ5_CHOCR|nr:unnamed protein product [Chondrus crispus]CDF35854.1 unnamed protein product [Chondrus crispus]|eukprot:XP_005715673.1 unnamed protein product [Chondrus crispus]